MKASVCLVFGALSTTVLFAQDAAPRYISGVLQTVNFGSTASIKVKTDEGIENTYIVNDQTKFSFATGTGTLTRVYQDLNGKAIKILVQKSTVGTRLVQIWDTAGWTAYLNLHEGPQMGTLRDLSGRIMVMTDKAYKIDDNTVFMLGGKKVGRKKFEGRTQIWIKGDTSSGFPVATVVGDTSASVNATVTNTNGNGTKRPASTGGGKRPASTGSSTAGTSSQVSYEVMVNFVIDDSDDTEGGEVGKTIAGVYMAADKKLECFGTLKFNGNLWWEVKEDNAKDVRTGKDEIFAALAPNGKPYAENGRFIVTGNTLKLNGKLLDWDMVGKPDELLKVDLDLSLNNLAGKGPQNYRTKDGKAAIRVSVVKRS